MPQRGRRRLADPLCDELCCPPRCFPLSEQVQHGRLVTHFAGAGLLKAMQGDALPCSAIAAAQLAFSGALGALLRDIGAVRGRSSDVQQVSELVRGFLQACMAAEDVASSRARWTA